MNDVGVIEFCKNLDCDQMMSLFHKVTCPSITEKEKVHQTKLINIAVNSDEPADVHETQQGVNRFYTCYVGQKLVLSFTRLYSKPKRNTFDLDRNHILMNCSGMCGCRKARQSSDTGCMQSKFVAALDTIAYVQLDCE